MELFQQKSGQHNLRLRARSVPPVARLPEKDCELFWSTRVYEIPNPKSQISNIKQITMTKIQNSKPVLVIEYWNLRFVCNLVLGI